MYQKCIKTFLYFFITLLFSFSYFKDLYPIVSVDPSSSSTECSPHLLKPTYGKARVYENTPYRPGEVVKYSVTFMGILAGYGKLQVNDPVKYENSWARSFEASGITGSWYNYIAFAKGRNLSIIDPLSWSALKVELDQENKKIFSKHKSESRVLTFHHDTCVAHSEKIKKIDNKIADNVIKDYDLSAGAMDVLSTVYWIREQNFEIGKTLKVPVYSSSKTWLLEATPEDYEEIETPIMKFKTVRLKVKTFVGEQLEQNGDAYAWVSVDNKYKPLVKLQANIKIGAVKMLLESFNFKN